MRVSAKVDLKENQKAALWENMRVLMTGELSVEKKAAGLAALKVVTKVVKLENV